MSDVGEIFHCLSSRRLSLSDEKKTQTEIADAFDECGISYEREFRLSGKDIIDFMIDGRIGIEIKIKGSRMAIFRQVERYAEHDAVKELILVTNVPTGFPKEVNGKPVYVLNLAKAWL